MMIKSAIAAAAIATSLLGASAAANAGSFAFSVAGPNGAISVHNQAHGHRQHYRHRAVAMPPVAAIQTVKRAGYHRAWIADFRGRHYVVRARDWRGRPALLKVNAFSGAIHRARYAHR